MKQQQFDDVINKLNTDIFFGISVFDLSLGTRDICRNKTKDEIIAQYGSIDAFFNGLYSNNITKIGIQPRRKNGMRNGGTLQNWKNCQHTPYFEVTMSDKNENTNLPIPTQPMQPIQAIPMLNQPSLNGGLSMPELIGLHVDRNDKTRLETENKYLKEKCDKQEKDIYEYKERELASKYSSDKAANNNALLMGLLQNADKLKGFFGGSGATGNVIEAVGDGLGNPNHSQIKNELIQAISVQPDAVCDALGLVMDGFQNANFYNELKSLLTKYNLTDGTN